MRPEHYAEIEERRFSKEALIAKLKAEKELIELVRFGNSMDEERDALTVNESSVENAEEFFSRLHRINSKFLKR